MIASDHPADRPRPLSLSLLIATLVAVAEIAARVFGTPESFSLAQLTLAMSANVATLGLAALIMAGIGLAILRTGKAGHARSYFLTAFITAGLLAACNPGRILWDFSFGVTAAMVAGGALLLPVAMGRLVRRTMVRFSIGLAWLVCAGTSAVAATKTARHLQPWMSPVTLAATPSQGQPNILVLMIDTLRFDRVGMYGDSKLTPNLDHLAESSIVYTEAISTAPWTLPTHASLFTGLYPDEHHVSWGHYELDDEHPMLAELLKQRGYDTFGISNNWLVSEANGFSRGFDFFLEPPNDPHIRGWKLASRCAAADSILQWLGLPRGLGDDAGSAWTNWLVERRLQVRRGKPFFGFINYFEPHDPYIPPPQYARDHLTAEQQAAFQDFPQRQDDLCAHACGLSGTFTEEQIELMSALYDAEVAYQDAMIGKLLDSLRQLSLLDNTWIVVTSDHGELFGESNMVFHTAGSHWQLLHVPLIVRPPGGVSQQVVTTPVQPVDIFHSLVEIAGATLPVRATRSSPLPMPGESEARRTLAVTQTFGASITGLYVTQYRALQADVSQWLRWMTSVYADGFLLELDDHGPRSLYDVRHDPAMIRDLLQEQPQRVESLLTRYRQWSGVLSGGAM